LAVLKCGSAIANIVRVWIWIQLLEEEEIQLGVLNAEFLVCLCELSEAISKIIVTFLLDITM
jgi:hypothetical protein